MNKEIIDLKVKDARSKTKGRKVFIVVFAIIVLFIADRYILMNGRITGNNWSFESGDYMGVDPIHFGQHCELRGGKVYFFEEKRELWVIGCYMGQLILYDFDNEILTRYSKW